MKQYPHRIAVAHTCVMSGEIEFLGAELTIVQRAVLGYLVSLASCRNARVPLFPTRSTIAKRIGIGMATVYRTLAVLARHGYIERLSQGRRRDTGAFARAEIQLSRELCRRLDLPFAELDLAYGTPDPVGKRHRASSMIDGAYIESYPVDHIQLIGPLQSNSEKHSQGPTRPDVIRYGRRTIPAELLPLVTEGQLRDVQLFTLMAWCRTAGKHLGTLLCAHWSCMRTLRGDRLFGYLTRLIASSSPDNRYRHAPSQHIQRQRTQQADAALQTPRVLAIDRAGGRRWQITGKMAVCLRSGDSLDLSSPAGSFLRAAIGRGEVEVLTQTRSHQPGHHTLARGEWKGMPATVRHELEEHLKILKAGVTPAPEPHSHAGFTSRH